MTAIFAIVLVIHGLVHLLGFAKAFHLAVLPQLSEQISPAYGVLWLAAAVLFVVAAVALLVWPRGWWMVGACAIGLSLIVIVPSWNDAKAGVAVNLIAAAGVAFGFLAQGPGSLRASYERDVDSALGRRSSDGRPLTDADLAHLPDPVQRYLRVAGVVGQPRVRNFRARMHGRIRSSPDARWITLAAEQHNFVDAPARLFYLTGSMLLIPVQGYHRYVGPTATMDIKAAALVPVVAAAGTEMDQGETVTMFNDMCLIAPATLVDRRAIVWQPLDARTARASFTNAGHTISAQLSFNDAGELIDFVSDDRYQLSPDGKTARKVRWSTPIGSYRSFGSVRLARAGEGRWHEPDREYAYIELTFDEVAYNVRSR